MDRKHTSLIIVLHSTAYYLLSYILILIFFQFITAFMAMFFDIPSIIYHNKIDFLVNTDSWNFDSVKMIFSSGSVISLILGLACLVVFLKASSFEGTLKLLFFWGFIHGLNIFVGSIVVGAFIYEGMGYVFAWMYLTDTIKMFLLFAGLIIMIGSGTYLVKPMLLSANSYFSKGRPEDRASFKVQQFFLPYLISTIILIVLRLPVTLYELLLLITPGLILLPLFSGLHRFTIFFFDDNDRKIRLNYKLIIIASAILIAYRVLMSFGLRLG